ncbi:LamG-like jellyroll fold domain-containing protein [Maribacter ulvicola]|uniref:LamG-like jellyroll fold domain-containing protein n=1 Tax=Maribacter ulvicola TaxID=228959 RepID=UPI0013564AAD|nr:LamG-like jellyroll fold domain-containing protein [Maribacter ulvicola]
MTFIFGFCVCQAQKDYGSLSKEEKKEIRLRSHLLIDLNSVLLDSLPIAQRISNTTPWAIIPSSKKNKNVRFLHEYSKYQNKLIVLGTRNILENIPSELSVVWVNDRDVETLNIEEEQTLSEVDSNGVQELLRVYVKNKDSLGIDKLLNVWLKKGKTPNFIETAGAIGHINSLVDSLNRQPKIYGVVHNELGELHGVSFKGYLQNHVQGNFSLPIDESQTLPALIPYKSGYYFSPDIIYTTPENRNNPKDFMAFPLNPEYALTHDYVFGTQIRNKLAFDSSKLISNNVVAKKDSVFGDVSYFSNGAFIDTGITSKSALKSNFSICAWIKPTQLDPNNSILGKGDNFVFKLHQGFLTFTMAGIKDYVSTSSPIPLNEWSHIALVYSKIESMLYFYVNGKKTDSMRLISNYKNSDFHLMIGSNLWEEFFVGYMKEVKIWERELNDKEVKQQFIGIPKASKDFSALMWWLIVVFLIAAVFFIFLYNFKKNKDSLIPRKKPVNTLNVAIHNGSSDSAILCFGPLRIMDSKGVEIAKKLTPLQKKMFIIVFLHSQNGQKGISTKELTGILWPGKSIAQAKNTRSTTIQNLRLILSSCKGVELIFKDKCWFMDVGANCFSNYAVSEEYLTMYKNEEYDHTDFEKDLPKLLSIISSGRLLANESYPWLDPFIEKFSNRVVELCIQIGEKLEIESQNELIFDLANVICIYDDLNEHALKMKLNVLIYQGKLSLANHVYDNFAKLYEQLYKEKYEVSFEKIIVLKDYQS